MEDMTPQPKKSFVEALRGLMNEFRDSKQTEREHTPKTKTYPEEGQETTQQRRKRSSQRTQLCQKDMATSKTLKKRKIYRKNRHKQNHNTILCDQTCLSVISCNENKIPVNELAILSQQTLTQTQKEILKKGLSFIPKPKNLNIYQLYVHNDIRQFMHRIKCKFELYDKPRKTKPRDPFETRKPHPHNPDRITDNGRLDTFLDRIRLEIINEHKHK